ncbi:MAG: metal-dependent transcriptional regulator [Bacteroidia bacterium]
MGFGWEEVHEIAEQMEHIKSGDFFNRMDELLGFPKVDPHGSPIPDREGKVQRRSFRKLSSYHAGDQVLIAAVVDGSDEFLRFLNSKNLQLGTELEVLEKISFDGSMTVRYGSHDREMLSVQVCERLLVEE